MFAQVVSITIRNAFTSVPDEISSRYKSECNCAPFNKRTLTGFVIASDKVKSLKNKTTLRYLEKLLNKMILNFMNGRLLFVFTGEALKLAVPYSLELKGGKIIINANVCSEFIQREK
jgi:hypothetical protein